MSQNQMISTHRQIGDMIVIEGFSLILIMMFLMVIMASKKSDFLLTPIEGLLSFIIIMIGFLVVIIGICISTGLIWEVKDG